MDIVRIKKALKTLDYQDRVSLCDEQGVHFAYLEAVLSQPGNQQSSFTATAFAQLVQRATTRWPALAQQMELQAAAQSGSATSEWLDLPAIHARLLPLAQAAGHEVLLLTVEFGHGLPFYGADATGGPSGFRRYIGRFDHGDTPGQFEGALTEKLLEQQRYLATHHAA